MSSCSLAGTAAMPFASALRCTGGSGDTSCGARPAATPASSSGLRRLVLSGNGIDAATEKALLAAASERPGLALVL